MRSIVDVLGKKFAGTLIEDPILEPYFITCESGAYTVSKKREDKSGALRYSDVSYPSSFEGCLRRIAKEKITEGKTFDSLQSFILSWKQINNEIFEIIKKAGIEEL